MGTSVWVFLVFLLPLCTYNLVDYGDDTKVIGFLASGVHLLLWYPIAMVSYCGNGHANSISGGVYYFGRPLWSMQCLLVAMGTGLLNCRDGANLGVCPCRICSYCLYPFSNSILGGIVR